MQHLLHQPQLLQAGPVGVAVNTSTANAIINITSNEVISLTNVSDVVEGGPNQLEVGRYYWLSTEPGKYTRDPDTTTSGSVLCSGWACCIW